MEANEILEGNKLIAEFMGMKIKPYTMGENPFTSYESFLWYVDNPIFEPKKLCYHSSWDWLRAKYRGCNK